MDIEIASTSLEISGRQGRILKVTFDAPLDELSIRRHRKELRAVHKSTSRHERDLKHLLLELDQVLSPFFIADDHTHPVRVLSGITLTAIVARKPPSDLGGLALDVYSRVLRELQAEGAFRQPIAGYPGLEALFADKVVSVIETVAQDRRKRGTIEQIDEAFYRLSTGRKLAAVACSVEASAVQSLDSSGVSRLTQLEQNVENIGHLFGEKTRSVPNLSGVTIKGIALAPGALDSTADGACDFEQVAKSATAYRRSLRLGGREVGAASAEFHVRIFRAIGLTAGDANELSAECLKAIVQKSIELHAAFEQEARAA